MMVRAGDDGRGQSGQVRMVDVRAGDDGRGQGR